MHDIPQNNSFPFKRWIRLFLWMGVFASCLAVVVKGFYLFSDTRDEPFIQGADDAFYMLWLRSLAVDGDVDFSNDIRETPFLDESAKQNALNEPLTTAGLVENKFTVGWAIVSAPMYFIAHLVAPWTPWKADGFSVPYQIGIWIQQILITVLGFYLMWRILARWFDSYIAITAILATWLISPMIYYQTARVSIAHNTVYVLGLLIFWLALKIREHLEGEKIHKRRMVFLAAFTGVQAGLLVICRPSALIYLILPFFLIVGAMIPLWKKHPVMLLGMASVAMIGALVGLFPQLLAWKIVYGKWIYYSYEGEGFNWGSPRIYASLFSPHHGLFNWHPMLLVGLMVLIAASWKRQFYRVWILVLVLTIWTNSSWHMVYFGSAFGGRAYEFLLCFATIGTAFLLDRVRSHASIRNTVLSIYTLFATWNIVFMYLYMQGIVPRELPVSWPERLSAVCRIFGS